jgi:glycine betaine/choline ABC-type transport system substrate-binding protein
MYKIRDDALEKIKKLEESGGEFSYTAWSNAIEKVELQKVELKEHNAEYFRIEKVDIGHENEHWFIYVRSINNYCITISVRIGKRETLKSISDFNEKCALLMGFELIEAEESGK